MDPNMVKCKVCGSEIAKKAKVCPKCGVKQKKHTILWIVLVVLGIILVIGAIGGGDSNDDPKISTGKNGDQQEDINKNGEDINKNGVENDLDSESVTKKDDTSYEITYQNVRTYTNSIGTTYAQVIVEIENTGTSDLYLSTSSYDLEDENGNLVTSNSMVSTYPDVISPGEKGYMYEDDMLDEPVEGSLTLLPRPNVKKSKIDNIRYNITDVELVTDTFGSLRAKGRVENQTSEDADVMIYIVLILKDANGTPIGQMFTILSEDLPSGDKIGFEVSGMGLPDDITIDSVAGYEVFAYPMQLQF